MNAPAPVSRQRWLIPVVVVVLSVTIGGGLLARELYQRPEPAADTREPVVAATSTSLQPSQEPGSDQVQITEDVWGHPAAADVRALLTTYFKAINTKDYNLWSTVVTKGRLAQQPKKDWEDGVQTTKDGSILVYRIERGAGESQRVLVGFTSVQDPANAPSDLKVACIRWRLMLPVVYDESNRLRIDTVDNTTQKLIRPEHDPC